MLDMLKRPTVIDLDDIVINGGTQPRAALNQETIAEYAEALLNGDTFPPVVIFYDGKDHWLADGFHRYHAHRRAEFAEINADIRQGTRRDAVLYSVSANSDHGLRRTNEDKRRSVMMLLKDEEWGKWSDREIARRCKVHHQMVGSLRSSLDESSSEQPTERTYTTRHGTVATMDTSEIAAANAKRAKAPEGEGYPIKRPGQDEPKPQPEAQPRFRPLSTADWSFQESGNLWRGVNLSTGQRTPMWYATLKEADAAAAAMSAPVQPQAQPAADRRLGILSATLAAAITSLNDDDLRNVAARINIGMAYGDVINELRRLHQLTKLASP